MCVTYYSPRFSLLLFWVSVWSSGPMGMSQPCPSSMPSIKHTTLACHGMPWQVWCDITYCDMRLRFVPVSLTRFIALFLVACVRFDKVVAPNRALSNDAVYIAYWLFSIVALLNIGALRYFRYCCRWKKEQGGWGQVRAEGRECNQRK